jgi:heat shock protein HslJ
LHSQVLIMTFRSFFVLLVVAATAGACSQSPAPTAPSLVTDDQLVGTWILASIEPAGQDVQAAPGGARYTVTFAEGRLTTRVDCNVCNGALARSGDALTTGPALACTRAACPTMAFGHVYTSLLTGESTVTLDGDVLVLSSARGALHFRRN